MALLMPPHGTADTTSWHHLAPLGTSHNITWCPKVPRKIVYLQLKIIKHNCRRNLLECHHDQLHSRRYLLLYAFVFQKVPQYHQKNSIWVSSLSQISSWHALIMDSWKSHEGCTTFAFLFRREAQTLVWNRTDLLLLV